MKKTIITAIAVLSLALGATAQNAYVAITLPTQTVAAGAVTNLSSQVVDVTKQGSVMVQITAKQSAAGTNGPINLVFNYSVDRTNWSTLTKTATFAATGLTELVGVTNIPSYGARFIRVKSLENADSGVITNVTINYSLKVGAP